MAAGSKSARSKPLDGLARLISAITAGRLARCGRLAGECFDVRALAFRRGDLNALGLDDALEDVHFFNFCVKATKASSFCLAAPLLMACAARSTPALKVGATPAT